MQRLNRELGTMIAYLMFFFAPQLGAGLECIGFQTRKGTFLSQPVIDSVFVVFDMPHRGQALS